MNREEAVHDEFFRFPHTPHLLWLGDVPPRADKVLATPEADAFLAHEVTVEEKVDGANIGLSIDAAGSLRAQNRGAWLARDTCHPQFRPLFRWMDQHRYTLVDHLPRHVILFGEWCYAVHSVRYTHLPDWFLAFDVHDREASAFWDMPRRDALVATLGLARVPQVAAGHFTLPHVPLLLGSSQLVDGPAEGVYLKWSAGGDTASRAKVVRQSFVQGIDEHWAGRPLEVNGLASGAVW
jgi:hypothetical protein